MSPSLSILILNYNGQRLNERCLAAIRAQTWQDFEIVVVDNASQDGSREWWMSQADVRFLDSGGNLGFAGGNNFGLPHCLGQWVFFLNNDAFLEPDCLAKLMKFAEQNPNHVCGPLMLQDRAPDRIDSGGDYMYTCGTTFKYYNADAAEQLFGKDREVQCICGGAALYPMSLLDKIGGFDEDFFLTCEDLDLGLRARHAGAQAWIVAEAKVRHWGGGSMGSRSAIDTYFFYRNIFWLKIKNYPLSLWICQAPFQLLLLPLIWLSFMLRGPRMPFIKARWDRWSKLASMIKKRQLILKSSVVHPKDFARHFRPRGLREKLMGPPRPSL